ncbi:MAG: hypothetical protein MK105_19435 [Crocinitomicaceae bacterium]|nr:hypothetical protein [Crocinitomicaceae bacterium]
MKVLVIILAIALTSTYSYCQNTSTDNLMGTWTQIQDSTITLIIEENKWIFNRKDKEGKKYTNEYLVTYFKSEPIEGRLLKGLGIARLNYESNSIEYNVDGIKGRDALYLTDLKTMEAYGYLRK